MESRPESAAWRRLLVILTRVVSVLCLVTKTRLELIKEVIVIKVGLELRRDHSLKNVGNEGQIGNRSIVV